MRRFLLFLLVSFVLFFAFVPVTLASEPADSAATSEVTVTNVEPPTGLPMHYALLRRSAPMYRTLADVAARNARGWLGGPDTWVSVYLEAMLNGKTYYFTGYGWMPADALRLGTPSKLQGVDLRGRSEERLAIVYWPKVNIHSKPGVAQSVAVVGNLGDYNIVSILEEKVAGGAAWYRIGDDQWIHNRYVRRFEFGQRPAQIGPDEKWIEVNLDQQVVIAYEGDEPVYGALASTGIWGKWPTVQGLFRIWGKYQTTRMDGGDTPADAYDLADVPWTMYFHAGYALHAAYWHDKFGAVRSHGCVNLSPVDSRWLFDWAGPAIPLGETSVKSTDENPGTWVWVHR